MTPQQNLALHRAVWIGAAAGVVLAFGAYLVAALQSGFTAPAGTTVAGVDIGGLTREEAQRALEQAVGPTARKRLRLVALDQTFIVRPAAAGLTLDAAASVAPAFHHTWNPIDLVGRILGGDGHPAVVAVDEAALAAQTSSIADALAVAPVEPMLEIVDGEPVLTVGKAGRSLDQAATAESLIDAVLVKRAPVQATVVKVEPSVTPQAQAEAMTLARAAVSAPVAVRAGKVTANIPATAIGRALSFTVVDGALVPSLDGAVLHDAIRTELAPIEVDGRDATFRIRNGKPRVVKSKVGRGVSDEALAAAVGQVLAAPPGERTVTVPVGVREPALTTEQAQALGVTERLSTFTQGFPYAAYRVQNIGQAAERINGTLLLPGETFSLNDTILERTPKNGYTEGFVIGEGGVFAEALGGGVSTSATAVWTAAFYAGMERVQTVAHSIYISRYKPGLEATVAWGLFDLKFRNDMPTAVFIASSITNDSITVSFWGTKQFDSIEAEYGNRTNIRKFDTIYDKSKGCLGQGGVDGFTITVDRVFYKDGEEVRREPITTTYKPAPEVICGKKPVKPEKPEVPVDPSASPSASASPSDPAAGQGGQASPSPSPTKPGRLR